MNAIEQAKQALVACLNYGGMTGAEWVEEKVHAALSALDSAPQAAGTVTEYTDEQLAAGVKMLQAVRKALGNALSDESICGAIHDAMRSAAPAPQPQQDVREFAGEVYTAMRCFDGSWGESSNEQRRASLEKKAAALMAHPVAAPQDWNAALQAAAVIVEEIDVEEDVTKYVPGNAAYELDQAAKKIRAMQVAAPVAAQPQDAMTFDQWHALTEDTHWRSNKADLRAAWDAALSLAAHPVQDKPQECAYCNGTKRVTSPNGTVYGCDCRDNIITSEPQEASAPAQAAEGLTDEQIDAMPVYAYEVTSKNGNSQFAYAAWFHKYGNSFKRTCTYEPMVRLCDVRAALAALHPQAAQQKGGE